MKKNKFVRSTLILVIGGFFTKFLGMFVRIISTRLLGVEGIGIYYLLNPTFMLLIVLAQLGLPTAISKLVAENKSNNKSLVLGIIPFSLFINLIIILFLILFSKFISCNLLHEPRAYLSIICIGFVLPFISISSIMRGYFFGKERFFPHVISNIIEDIVRIFTIVIFIPMFNKFGLEYAVAFFVFSNLFSEVASILVMYFFLPKKFNVSYKDFRSNKSSIKNIMGISIPITSSRLIGNIGYFFEPIIVTSILLKVGYSNSFILKEYGIINGYALSVVMLPSFFTMAISQVVVPVVSRSFSDRKFDYVKKKIRQAIFFSLVIGIPMTLIFLIFPDYILMFLYNTHDGVLYLRILACIFLIQYIQGPISASLQAIGKAKVSMIATIMSTCLKLLCLFVFSWFRIGLFSIIIAIGVSVISSTVYEIYKLKKYLF